MVALSASLDEEPWHSTSAHVCVRFDPMFLTELSSKPTNFRKMFLFLGCQRREITSIKVFICVDKKSLLN